MQTSLEFAQHLNQFREKITKGVVKRIPDIAYNTYRSKFSQPTVGEGFTEIVPITWVPEFPDDAHRKLFLQFTES
jgi:bifunctional polynucleotide phosphatase/kinase